MLTCEFDDERLAFDDFYRRRRAGGLITPYLEYRATPASDWYLDAGAIVTLDDMKAHLRIDGTDEDSYITGLLTAAASYVQDVANRIILRSAVTVRWIDFPPSDMPLFLPFGGVSADWDLGSVQPIVQYVNASGVSSAPADLSSLPAGLALSPQSDWPLDRDSSANASVFFQDTVTPLTDNSQLATSIRMLAGYWYNAREAVVECKPERLPLAFDALVANNTSFNFGGRWK